MLAFGQPARLSWLCPLVAAFGIALFLAFLPQEWSKKKRFWISTAWFAGAELIQLSWMTSIEFQGYYILGVWAGIALMVGLQFGVFSLLTARNMTISWTVGLACLWALFEWVRLLPLCGFSLNPLGLTLTWTALPLQLASVGGILGLSFWAMWTNLLFLKAWRANCKTLRRVKSPFRTPLASAPPRLPFQVGRRQRVGQAGPVLRNGVQNLRFSTVVEFCNCLWRQAQSRVAAWSWAVGVAFVPYAFGALHLHYHAQRAGQVTDNVKVALVQTALLPSQKIPLLHRASDFISSEKQWAQILTYFGAAKQDWDLIVFPEAAFPYQADAPLHPFAVAKAILVERLGPAVIDAFPPLEPPFAYERKTLQGAKILYVSHLFFAKTLAQHFNAEVLIGLDHHAREQDQFFNAAFLLRPKNSKMERYDKKVLLPLAEYLPFNFLAPLSRAFGIHSFFSRGTTSSTMGERMLLTPSICYEETFSEIMRRGVREGGQLMVNLTNDNYYPNSTLPQQHFSHAKPRTVENGRALIRACNTGVTGVIDSLGQTCAVLGDGEKKIEWQKGILTFELKLYNYSTLYSFLGELGIVILCFCGLFISSILNSRINFFFKPRLTLLTRAPKGGKMRREAKSDRVSRGITFLNTKDSERESIWQSRSK